MELTDVSDIQAQEKIFKDYYTPLSVIRLMTRAIGLHSGNVYDPCCGSGAILASVAAETRSEDLRLFGQTISKDTAALCQANLCLLGADTIATIEVGNTLEQDRFENERFDYIITNPPFNVSDRRFNTWRLNDARWQFGSPPRYNANFAWIQHILYHLKEGGRAAILLPSNVLRTNDVCQKEICRNILEEGLLEAVITFPKYLFATTEIPFCIWILSKSFPRQRRVLLLDAERITPKIGRTLLPEQSDLICGLIRSHRERAFIKEAERFCVSVPIKKIAEQEYQLVPGLYLPFDLTKQKKNEKRIEEISQKLKNRNISPQLRAILDKLDTPCSPDWEREPLLTFYTPSIGLRKSVTTEETAYPYIDLTTVLRNDFLPDRLPKKAFVSDTEIARFRIQAGDILLSRVSESKKSLGRCCVCVSDRDAVYGDFLKLLRPTGKEKLYPPYVCAYLQSAVFRQELEDYTPPYLTRLCLNNTTLSKLSVYFPDPMSQRFIGDTFYEIFEEMQKNDGTELMSILAELKKSLIEQYITNPIVKQFEEKEIK